jgi:peptide/nickel transport system substrate-binding protein
VTASHESTELRVSRRTALRFIGAGTGTLLLAACAPIAPATQSGPTAAATAAPQAGTTAAQPTAGGKLRLNGNDPSPLDGHTLGANTQIVTWHIWEPLVYIGKDMKLESRLAESYDASSDLKQIKFNLRKGVQFHTGREFTSADIAWNMEHVLKPQGTANFAVQAKQWTFETPDKYTVIFTSDQPRPFAWEFFHNFNMLDPVTGQGPDALTKAVGTGPFAMAEWIQGDRFVLTKNKNYWKSGRPYLDEINFSILADAQAPVVQLEAGTLDMILLPPLRDAVRLRQNQAFQVVTNKYAGSFFATLNLDHPPLQDKRVRQALNYAIDRKRWAESTMLGEAEPVDLPWGPLNLAYEAGKNSRYTFDLDKAGALLKDAGVSSAEFDYLVQPQHTERVSWGEMFQADVAKLGIKINITKLDTTNWNAVTSAGNGPPKYKGINGSPTGQGGNGEPANTAFATSNWWRFDGVNASNYKSDAYKDLVNKLLVEPDPSKRKGLYSQVNDIILDDAWLLIYATRPDHAVVSKKVHGFDWAPFSRTEFTDVWMDG